jgi:hypothetical protein
MKLHVSDNSSVHHQEFFTVNTAMKYVIQVCWLLARKLSACPQAVSKPVWHISLLCLQWKTPDDGQRNCPKHVEFYFKNKFEKLLHLVGFIIRYPRRLASQFFASCFVLCARDNVEPWVQHCYSDQAPVHRYCCIPLRLVATWQVALESVSNNSACVGK